VTDKIRSTIKKMTFRLLVEQKDEYEHELWCDMETGKSTETWDDKPGKEVLTSVKVMGAETSIKLLVKQITRWQWLLCVRRARPGDLRADPPCLHPQIGRQHGRVREP